MVEERYRDVVCRRLAAVADGGAATAGAVAAALARGTGAEPLALSGALEAMADDGLVEVREREDGAARRRAYALTAAGRERAAATRERDARGDAGEGSDSGSVAPFVGRTEALATLRDALETDVAGESPVVVVEGPAGVGKSRLVREATDRLAGDRPDLVVAAGRARPGPDEPFGAVRRALAPLPDVAATLAGSNGDVELPVEPAGLLAARTALFEAVADALRAAAATDPVVVFVDDLQWVDPASGALLSYLATAVDDLAYPLALVVAHRPSAVGGEADTPAGAVLSTVRAAREVTTVSPAPLSRGDVAELLAEGRASDPPSERVHAVHGATGGVPAAVRHAAVRGDDPASRHADANDDAGTLAALVERRVAAAGDDLREVIRLGAVLGDPVPRAVLAAASDLGDARRRECVDALLAAGVWEPVEGDPAGAGRDPTTVPPAADLRFATPAVREAVLEGLAPAERADYHAAAADAYRAVHGESLGDLAALAGRHREAAGEHATAVECYRTAGNAALSAHSPAVAAARYERAVAVAGAADEVDEALLADVHGSLGDARRVLGRAADVGSARARSAAGDAPGADGDRDRRGHALRQLSDIARRLDEHDRAVEWARRGVERARAVGDVRVEAHALNLLATLHFERGEREAAAACFRRARDRWDAVGDRQSMAENVSDLGIIAWQRGDYDRARRLVERALEIDDADEPRAEVKRLNNLGIIAAAQGEYEASREYGRACLDRLTDAQDPQVESKVLNNLGEAARRLGEYDLARERYEESLAIKRELDNRRGEGRTLTNVARTAARRGASEVAREHLDESLEIAHEVDDPRGVVLGRLARGLVAVADRRPAAAAEQFRDALDVAADTEDRRNQARCRRGLGLAALERDDPAAATDHLETAAELMDQVDDPLEGAKVRLARGRVALARDEPDRARDLATSARRTFQEVGASHRLGESLLVVGRAARASDDRTAALGALQTALATLSAVDAPMDELAVLRELIDLARESDPDLARALCRRAEGVLADAPPAVVDCHGGWVRRLGEGLPDGPSSGG